ncbi:MAG: hypothetical protein R3B38_01625 [Patescibacteria group bacterium]
MDIIDRFGFPVHADPVKFPENEFVFDGFIPDAYHVPEEAGPPDGWLYLDSLYNRELVAISLAYGATNAELMSNMASEGMLPASPREFINWVQSHPGSVVGLTRGSGENGEYGPWPIRAVDAMGKTIVCAYANPDGSLVISQTDPGRNDHGYICSGSVLVVRYLEV